MRTTKISSFDVIPAPSRLFDGNRHPIREKLEQFHKRTDDTAINAFIMSRDDILNIELCMQMCAADTSFHKFNCSNHLRLSWRDTVTAYIIELSNSDHDTHSTAEHKITYALYIPDSIEFVDAAIGLYCYSLAIQLDKNKREASYISYLNNGIKHHSIHALKELLFHYYDKLDNLITANPKAFHQAVEDLSKLNTDCRKICDMHGCFGQMLLADYYAQLSYYLQYSNVATIATPSLIKVISTLKASAVLSLSNADTLKNKTGQIDAYASLGKGLSASNRYGISSSQDALALIHNTRSSTLMPSPSTIKSDDTATIEAAESKSCPPTSASTRAVTPRGMNRSASDSRLFTSPAHVTRTPDNAPIRRRHTQKHFKTSSDYSHRMQ